MSKRGAFKQSEVSAVIKSAQKCGLSIARIEAGRDGKIALVVGTAESTAPAANQNGDIVL